MSPSAALISPDTLDREAAALYESATWQRIVTDWTTAPPHPATPGPVPGTTPDVVPDPERWRALLTLPVDRLVADALDALPPPLPVERLPRAGSAPSCPTGCTPGAASASPNCAPRSTSATRAWS